ncbi:MAG: hypothetical protein QOE65_123 [Solirubrobacteraceae bacterium]|jgi:hypothetical protein|nr:hypothetical protein [Solirubrobacteraceae bacterium]
MAESQERSEESQKAEEALERHEEAKETIKKLEDDPPKDLKDWPDDESKYLTFGGGEGDHGYDEGPEKKLGPSSLERREDGSVAIEGEEVDNPDDYKGDPIPGGPSDPNAPALAGEDPEDTEGGEGEADEDRGEGSPDAG